jgi:hypothetical protein
MARWATLVKIFRLSSKITLTSVSEINFIEDFSQKDISTFKFFSRYIDIDKIHVFGEERKVNVTTKPCIGLAISGGEPKNKEFFDNIELMIATTDNWQKYHRYHTLQTNNAIFELLTLAGYDVITLDSFATSLEHKALVINDLCDCVIGYEGGMMHLAHALKVPTIILPRRYDTVELTSHMIHLDKMTYFVNDEKELLNWSVDDLKSKILDLKKEKGNNFFFNNTLKLDPISLRIWSTNNIEILYPTSPKITDIVKQYIANPQIGGY